MEGKIAAIKRIVDKIEPQEFIIGLLLGILTGILFGLI